MEGSFPLSAYAKWAISSSNPDLRLLLHSSCCLLSVTCHGWLHFFRCCYSFWLATCLHEAPVPTLIWIYAQEVTRLVEFAHTLITPHHSVKVIGRDHVFPHEAILLEFVFPF